MNGFTEQFRQRLRESVIALAQRQPGLANQLGSVQDFGAARLARGRDGSDVVLLERQDGANFWLGGSSMPTISGPVVIDRYAHRNDSVLLPSIGTGYEPALLAQKLAGHSAVFVYEQSPQRLALGLGICDYAELITAGGVVLLCGDLANALVEFFETNGGYALPAQLWPLPDVPSSRLNKIAHAMRQAIARVHQLQTEQMAQASARLARAPIRKTPSAKKLWIASRDFGPRAAEHADRLARAAQALGYQVRLCMPNHPARAGELARMRSAADFDPDVAIWINSCPAGMSESLPRAKQVAWYLETASLPAAALNGLDRCESVYVASETIRPLVTAHGADPDRIRVLEIGVDSHLFTPEDDGGVSRADEVLVLADGCDVSPAAAGVGLESHTRIWNQFCKLLDNDPDSFGPPDLEPWLSRCEKMTGSPLADEKLRRDFAALIAPRLPATLITRATVLALDRAGVRVRLLGSGWDSFDRMKEFCEGPIPPAEIRLDAYRCAVLMVAPWWDGQSVQFAQEALAAGCLPVLRKPEPQRLKIYPQSCDLLAKFPTFGDRGELVKTCRQLLSDTPRRSAILANFRDRFLEIHSTEGRLQSLISHHSPARTPQAPAGSTA